MRKFHAILPNQKFTLPLVIIGALFLSLVITLNISQRRQESRSQAAGTVLPVAVAIDPSQSTVPSITGLTVGATYKIVAQGVVDFDDDQTHLQVDPQWGGDYAAGNYTCFCARYSIPKLNGASWAAENVGTGANSAHSYTYYWVANSSTLQFSVSDSNYTDNSGTISVTVSLHSVPTNTPTLTPTPTNTPTPTPVSTKVSMSLLLHGLGKAGDAAKPGATGGGNTNPLHPQRTVTVQVFNAQNQLVVTKQGQVNYNTTTGSFKGTVDLGTTITNGIYTVKVKTNQFLNTLIPGIQSITAGSTHQLPEVSMINGDINNDNVLNILDYTILLGCYSDFQPPASCTTQNKVMADLNDDGDVNQFDYNLFLRELTNVSGK